MGCPFMSSSTWAASATSVDAGPAVPRCVPECNRVQLPRERNGALSLRGSCHRARRIRTETAAVRRRCPTEDPDISGSRCFQVKQFGSPAKWFGTGARHLARGGGDTGARRDRWAGPKDARLPYLIAIVKTNCDSGNLSGRGVDWLWFWWSLGIHSERRTRRRCPGVDILCIPHTSRVERRTYIRGHLLNVKGNCPVLRGGRSNVNWPYTIVEKTGRVPQQDKNLVSLVNRSRSRIVNLNLES